MRKAVFVIFLLLLSSVAVNAVGAEPKKGFVANEMIVGLEDVNSRVLSDIEESWGDVLELIPSLNALRVSVAPSMENAFITTMKSKPEVRYVERNVIFKVVHTPNDPYWSYQWGMRIIQADSAWDIHSGSASVIVAVIDTGIEYTHDDLSEHYVALGYDWVNNDNDPMDDNGHGTHVAGIAAAVMDNEIGVVGVAQVSLMAEKVLGADGSGTADDVAQGIIHAADAGAEVISISLGSYFSSALVEDACQYAWNKGSILVAAAGNDNLPRKFYPAAYDTVIAVAATDQYDKKASYSNWGDWIELSAPGGDGDDYHDWILSTYIDNWYAWAAGTSMAAPHVSGLAALVWSYEPSLTNQRVREHLRNTSDDLGASGKDKYYGYGRINACRALRELSACQPNYLVVRGYNNGIYYRSYNSSSWSSWNQLPGATLNGTAAAVYQNNLHIVVNGMNGGLYWGYVNLTDSEFSGWTGLSGATPSTPTLASSSSYLCLVVQGTHNGIWYRIYDGSSWGGWNRLPGATPMSPAAAILGDRYLHLVVTGVHGGLYWGNVDLTTSEFSGWMGLSGATPSKPTLASSSDSLYLAVRGYNNGIYYRSYNCSSWSGWNRLPGATIQSPATEVYNDSLHIVVVGTNGGFYWGNIPLATSEFSGWTGLDGATPSEPTLAC